MPENTTEYGTDPFLPYKIVAEDGSVAYAAGYPSYPANFSRDTLIAGILASHGNLLASQLEISAHYQGTMDDALTGEQPGRIHHEIPRGKLPDREGYTTYNACDTTALFLIGAEALSHVNAGLYGELYAKREDSLQRAAEHILAQTGVDNALFWEKPPAGADHYNLRVTYWKDSILPRADGKLEPTLPVSYGLTQFMAARGILSAARVLGMPDLEKTADKMYRAGIETFMSPEHYIVYEDMDGKLLQASSDELHALAYIPATYAKLLPISEIGARSEALVTPYGYMCTPPAIAQHLPDGYHGDKVWVFEQAMINYGAVKFGLHKQAAIAQSIAPHIGEGQELFSLEAGRLKPEGNTRQLWSVAAATYFNDASHLRDSGWL